MVYELATGEVLTLMNIALNRRVIRSFLSGLSVFKIEGGCSRPEVQDDFDRHARARRGHGIPTL